MATWIVHLMVVDKLLEIGLDVDERGFVVGNIGPDCNVENEDWTEFTPTKEVTHWMNKKCNKLSADYERFYNKHIKDLEFISHEHRSFLLGYYAHLIVDVEFQKFVRDEMRVEDIYIRLKNYDNLYNKVKDYPQNFDTLKEVFGRQNIFNDIYIQEYNYVRDNPNSKYNTVLKDIKAFPEYLEYFPKASVSRKIGIIVCEYELEEYEAGELKREHIFFPENELISFIDKTSDIIYDKLSSKTRHMKLDKST